MKRRLMLAVAAAATLTSLAVHAQQSGWPTRPVRLIVPWAAGGSTDTIARTLALKLSERWGQQVIVENKPGANSIIGASEAARAAPDGYTLFVPISATMTANQFMYSKLPYEPLRDFTPIAIVASIPFWIIMAGTSAPGKTLSEFIDLARKNPGTVTFASAAPAQIQVETWMRDWGVKFSYIPYKSAVDVTKALMGQEVHLGVDAISNNLQHIKAGKINALAVNTASRMPMLPDVPTMAELKIKHTEPQIWHAIVAPAGLPVELQNKINADIQTVLALPDVNTKLVNELRPGGRARLRPAGVLQEGSGGDRGDGPADQGAWPQGRVARAFRAAKPAARTRAGGVGHPFTSRATHERLSALDQWRLRRSGGRRVARHRRSLPRRALGTDRPRQRSRTSTAPWPPRARRCTKARGAG